MLSVSNSCDYNESSKNRKIVFRQMPAPRDLPQQIPAPRAKIRMQKPRSGGKFSMQIPGGARGGGWLWQKLITALTLDVRSKMAKI